MLSNAVLKYHYHPRSGWISDPNGLVFYKGWYHIFYQNAPHHEKPWMEPMVWGHARTRDFLNWEELPTALPADQEYDKGGIWSGTAIVKDDVLYVFYASVLDGNQTISAAYSTDGINFTKFESNPIIRVHPEEGSDDFRDPAVFCENGINYLVVASADKRKNTGNLLLYKSKSFENWEYCGVLYEYEDSKYCECPSFVKYNEKYILSTSVGKNSGEHYFEVLYGSFNGQLFTPEIISHFQKGPDEYAGQIFKSPDGRVIMFSWIPGWKYKDCEKCIGCMSLPLEIKVKDNKILAYPVDEVRHLIDENDTLTDGYITEKFINKGEEVHISIKTE